MLLTSGDKTPVGGFGEMAGIAFDMQGGMPGRRLLVRVSGSARECGKAKNLQAGHAAGVAAGGCLVFDGPV
ncbi:hypothetical protein [Rhodovulum bhavnagarense]|uniref:hypothetical protein n=1 Tax=Rhodovulum bhavnagarense TaxID=992286 RepID=UPI00104FE8A2|nr:hypothetical protein [Rhodovulum bhavnagarense]